MTDITTIRVKTKTREELARLGRKGDSYDDLILKLIKDSEDEQR